MKNMLQKFDIILSILFVILSVIWQIILQDFVFVWQKTPCPVCHPAMACLPHWSCFNPASPAILAMFWNALYAITHQLL